MAPAAQAAKASPPKKKGDSRNLPTLTVVFSYARDMNLAIKMANRQKEAGCAELAEAFKTRATSSRRCGSTRRARAPSRSGSTTR